MRNASTYVVNSYTLGLSAIFDCLFEVLRRINSIYVI